MKRFKYKILPRGRPAYLYKYGVAPVFGAALLLCGGVRAMEVKVPVSAPSRLQVLERKANDYERCRAQYVELQKMFDDMLAVVPPTEGGTDAKAKFADGELSVLLEKAATTDALTRELEEIRARFDRLQQQCEALKEEVETCKMEQKKTLDSVQSLKDSAEKWKVKAAGLRETVERLLLGEFEYYEVKEGDTLQGIAANPMVYGDVARATWLRQVNESRVKHLDNLRKGEVLIVPRFPRNGSYEF